MDASWVEKWRGMRVFVLGDVMLDKFVNGQVERISPEAPIPVLHFQSEWATLGGAGNVARNIVALGGEAVLVGAIGEDPAGDSIVDSVPAGKGIDGRFVRLTGHPTTVKTRFVCRGQQIMRLDVEQELRLDEPEIEIICRIFAEVAETIAAVVLSDYGKGLLTNRLIERIIGLARRHGLPVVVDPKSRDISRYSGATVMTPNASEAASMAGFPCTDDASAQALAKRVRDLAGVDAVVLTRGAQGMTVVDPTLANGGAVHIATVETEVFDVSGAGDTVVAALALALGINAPVTLAARIANVAAGIAVGKRGTAVVQARELAKALAGAGGVGGAKLAGDEEVAAIVANWKAQGLKVGFTNGCFDLLHPGHVELLKNARAACDRLVVALNCDLSVRRLKGPARPVQNEHARSMVIAAIDGVDLVTLFAEDTPLRLIEVLKPDVLVKGANYTAATVVGADFVLAHGGKLVLVPLEGEHSTTSIIERALSGEGK